MFEWDIYEVTCLTESIKGVMFRGRIRKFCLEHDLNCLAENATDAENTVRFALVSGSDAEPVKTFITSITPDAAIEQIETKLKNPVLSKMKVNIEARYTI